MAKNLGIGDKPKMGKALDLGLSDRESIKGGSSMPLRGETNEKSQRPTAMSKTVSSDRGSFQSIE